MRDSDFTRRVAAWNKREAGNRMRRVNRWADKLVEKEREDCAGCGHPLDIADKFCSDCGASIST